MKTSWLVLLGLAASSSLQAADAASTNNPPPPISVAPPRPATSTNTYNYEQRLYAPAGSLVAADQARAIVEKFRAAAPQLKAGRILIYVNRELVDEKSGLKLSARTEKTVSTRSEGSGESTSDRLRAGTNGLSIAAGGNVIIQGQTSDEIASGKRTSQRVENENRYRVQDKAEPTLADKQTMREIEQVFGRPFRAAGVALADQRVAAQLIGDRALDSFSVRTESESTRKDREALTNIADVVIEILIAPRNTTVAEVSGDRTYAVPDIQASAIRLSDARILGQSSSADVMGKRPSAAVIRQHDTREITEATALALMEDMMLGVQ